MRLADWKRPLLAGLMALSVSATSLAPAVARQAAAGAIGTTGSIPVETYDSQPISKPPGSGPNSNAASGNAVNSAGSKPGGAGDGVTAGSHPGAGAVEIAGRKPGVSGCIGCEWW